MIDYRVPVSVPVIITQSFQEHLQAARSMKTKYNGGIDLAPTNQADIYEDPVAIYAAAAGQVVQARWDVTGYGNCIIIQHQDGSKTLYAHLEDIEVGVPEHVEAGDCIGYMGSTGNSTGKHLHFEIIRGGIRVDPQKYINFAGAPYVEGRDAFFPPAIPAMAYVTPLEGVNIRSGPGTGYVVCGYVEKGDRLEVLEVIQNQSDIWLRVGHNQYACALFQGRALLKVTK